MKYTTSIICLIVAASAAAADVSETKEYSYELNPNGRVSLSNVNGAIDIKGVSGNRVHIVAIKKAGTQEYLDGLEIEVDASDDLIRIETHHPESGGGWFHWGDYKDGSGSVAYSLEVPAGVELDTIETVNGDIKVSGVTGSVNCETVNGGIILEGLENDAGLDTVNGTIDVQFSKLGSGQRVNVDAVNGKITMRLPENASAQIHAETLNGGIDADEFGLKPEKGFVGHDLDGNLGNGDARVNLDTVNGSITIKLD